ncbi:MAG: MOSC domain-containing protein [Chloroflexota bacterium]
MNKQAGKLKAIWLKRGRRGVMDAVDQADTIAHRGLANNTDQGGKRQVTILSKEVWDDLMQQVGASLDPSTRRANLLVTGIDLADTRGQTLQVGTVRIRIYGETKPCERMDEVAFGLREAMYENWGGGAYGEVLDDGQIAIGDPVAWLDESLEG